MQLRHRGGHVGVSLIGAHHNLARFGYPEVGPGHACIGSKELVAQALACAVSEVCGVVVARLAPYFLLKQLAHLFLRDVYGRHHYVAGLLVHQLQYTLAEVCLHHVYAVLLEVGVHLALLGEHRLAFHHLLHAVVAQYAEHDGVELSGILGPVDGDPVFFGVAGKLLQVFVEVCKRVLLDGTCGIAQLFPFACLVGHGVALGPQRPESLVVPCHFLGVGKECRGRL